MIPLPDVQSPDFRIDTKIPAGLVTAFDTITSGTRKHTLKPFVKHARRSRVCLWPLQKSWQFYCNRCPKLNSAALYTIIRSETGLDPNVNNVCHDTKSREKTMNLLYRSTGTSLSETGTLASLPDE